MPEQFTQYPDMTIDALRSADTSAGRALFQQYLLRALSEASANCREARSESTGLTKRRTWPRLQNPSGLASLRLSA